MERESITMVSAKHKIFEISCYGYDLSDEKPLDEVKTEWRSSEFNTQKDWYHFEWR